MNNQFYYDILVKNKIIKDTNRNNYNVSCPFHNETRGSSLSINFDKGIFCCFSPQCENETKGKLFKLCCDLGFISKNLQLEDHITDFSFSIDYTINSIEKENKKAELFDIENVLKYGKKDYSYLTQRNISKEVIERNKCVYSPYFRRFIMPVWQDNKCYGYVSRSTLTKEELDNIIDNIANEYSVDRDYCIKCLNDGEYDDIELIKRIKPTRRYTNNYGFLKELVIFESRANDYKKSNITVICEGQINAMMANTFGVNSFAIIGGSPTIEQLTYLLQKCNENNQTIILFFDNDKAGIKNVNKFNEIAGEIFLSANWSLIERENINDLNQLCKKEFELLINNPKFI